MYHVLYLWCRLSLCLDLFCGSGSLMKAAADEGALCFGSDALHIANHHNTSPGRPSYSGDPCSVGTVLIPVLHIAILCTNYYCYYTYCVMLYLLVYVHVFTFASDKQTVTNL